MPAFAVSSWADVQRAWRLETMHLDSVSGSVQEQASPTDVLCALAPTDVTVAVVVGNGRVSQLLNLIDRRPALLHVLVLQPEARLLVDLEAREFSSEAVQSVMSRCLFAAAGSNPRQYSTDAYLGIIRFLLNTEQPLDKVALGDETSDRWRAEARALHQVLQDLALGYSERFLKMATAPDTCLDKILLWRWVECLCQQQPFHALKFLYALGAFWPGRLVQVKIMNCWMKLGQADILMPLVETAMAGAPSYDEMKRELTEEMSRLRQYGAATLAANLEYLRERSAAAAEVATATAPDPTIHALQVGAWTILYRYRCDRLEQLSYAPSYEEVLRQFGSPASAGYPYQLLVGSAAGVNALQVKAHFHLTTEIPNWTANFYLVEQDPAVFRALLESFPLRDNAGGAQVVCFAGPAWEQQMDAYFASTQSHRPPGAQYLAPLAVVQAVDRWQSRYGQRLTDLRNAVEAHYASLTRESILAAFANTAERPLRILIPTSTHTTVLQYSSNDLAAGFVELGCRARVLIEKDPTGVLRFDTILGAILEFKPDLVVLLDHLRSDSLANLAFSGLPVACWVQDPMPYLFTREAAAKLGPLDFTYSITEEWGEMLRGLGYGHLKWLPFAVNSQLYRPVADIKPSNEAAILTRLSPAPCSDARPVIRQLDHELSQALDLEAAAARFEEDRADEFRRMPEYASRQLLQDMGCCTRFHQRTRLAEQLLDAGIPLAIWGRGWDALPRFAPYWKGEVEPGPDLCRLYQSYKVIFHQGFFLHPRPLEAMSSGGFVIVDGCNARVSERQLATFKNHADVVLAQTPAELVELTRRAFSDANWRGHLITVGSENARANHSYTARAKTILCDIRETLGRSP